MTVPDPVVVALVSGVFGIVAAVVAQRLARGAHREMYPAQVIENLSERLQRAEDRLDASLRRERLRDNYIHELRDHISKGKEPPPPPWPEGLTT